MCVFPYIITDSASLCAGLNERRKHTQLLVSSVPELIMIWMSWVGGWCFMTVQLNRASSGCTVAIIYKSSLVFCKRGFMRYLGICNLFRTVANCHQLQFGETDNRERFTTQIWKLVVLWYSHGILFIILSHAIDPIISRNYFWKYCR